MNAGERQTDPTDAVPKAAVPMRAELPALMSLNGGYVDTAGFLALQGLFTAHVTGNFVTIGASLVLGTSGTLAKLLALPVFCAIVMITRFLGLILAERGLPALGLLLAAKFVLLCLGAALAVHLGPLTDGDALGAVGTGMALVAAMAIQNAIHRIHLPGAPPTTLMTGTTTQIMIDVVDLLRRSPAIDRVVVAGRCLRMGASVTAFALGCAMAALAYAGLSTWCFALPPLVALIEVLAARGVASATRGK